MPQDRKILNEFFRAKQNNASGIASLRLFFPSSIK